MLRWLFLMICRSRLMSAVGTIISLMLEAQPSPHLMPPIWAQLVTAITSWLEPGLLAVQTSEIVILQLQLTRFRLRLASAIDTLVGTCDAGSAVDYSRPLTLGQAEIERAQILNTNAATGATLGDTNIMRRGADEYNDDFDDMGVAIRWYSEQLNSTEFGLFYQKYTSRLPYVSSRAAAPIVGLGAIGPKDGAFTRQYGIAGCASQDWQVLDLQPGEAGYDAANAVEFLDPLGVGAATNAVAKSIWDQSAAAFAADPTSAAGGIYAALAFQDAAGGDMSEKARKDMIADNPTTRETWVWLAA